MLRAQKTGPLLLSQFKGPMQSQAMQAQMLLRLQPHASRLFCHQLRATTSGLARTNSNLLVQPHSRSFASKKDKDAEDIVAEQEPIKKKRGRPSKAEKLAQEEAMTASGESPAAPTKKPRASRAKKAAVEASEDVAESGEIFEPKKAPAKRTRKSKAGAGKPLNMYVLKFNSPILPYAKFPLTHNRYIQEFIKMYEEDKEKVDRIIGVHFPQNNNAQAKGAVGIEITVAKKNNMTIIESQNSSRFKITDYDSATNFANVEGVEDVTLNEAFGTEDNKSGLELNQKDLLASELFELKNLWFTYNKKINQLLMILPQEVVNRYDMVMKSLQAPLFDINKYPEGSAYLDIFNEIVFKMAHFYFAVFQAIFSKDNEGMRPMIYSFIQTKDPLHRSRKLVNLYEEMHGIIDKKLYYVQKTAEEFKERSKTSLLEHAYQRVLEDNKQSEKSKFQEKLDAVTNMPESTRKVLQEEVNGLDNKNDMESARKITFLNNVFRLPWDKREDPFWDVHYSQEVLHKSHYGMIETKERILEFIAKNKRINSQKGMVLLLTGPPGVGKTSIAKSIGDCLKRPTTIISMGGQNDPIHIKGSKRTYVDSQPGIFVKELQRLESKNPVIVIDEIDKVGANSMKGDVSSTLLELLNPEQSNQFRDSYLDLEFDMSECIFICTSNSIANMLAPLIDRIEVIHVPAYLPVEKLNIAKQYIVPALQKEYAFQEIEIESETATVPVESAVEDALSSSNSHEKITLTDASIMDIVNHYCGHEAGVRNLKKALDRIFRKVVAKLESSVKPADQADQADQSPQETVEDVEYQINTKNLEQFLDIPPTDDNYFKGINKGLPVGSANGLAYVNDGYGVVLKIQIIKRWQAQQSAESEDKEEKKAPGGFTQTGRLGETFSESVEVVKIAVFNLLAELGQVKDFDKNSYHLHVPMGATPKDGPSAGVSLFSALTSSAIDRPVASNLAMTGEITTLGEVISIGGVREKLTACKNHNITRVILPASNRKNVTKLPDEFKKGFTIYYVNSIRQLYSIAFPEGDHAEDTNLLNQSLLEQGVEIDEFEEDTFHKVVIDGEIIQTDNQIEQLF